MKSSKVCKEATLRTLQPCTSHQNNSAGGQHQNKQRHDDKGNLFCTHCNLRGHTKEICYKLVGYPLGHKYNRRNPGQYNRNAYQGNNKTSANNVTVENTFAGGNDELEPLQNQLPIGGLKMSQEQVNNLMSLINSMNNKDSATNSMAGMTCLTSISMNKYNWIIESGATKHITPHADLLHEIIKMPTPIRLFYLMENMFK